MPPFYNVGERRVVQTSKYYFTDTGLTAYLCGFKNAREIIKSNHAEKFLETYVVSEIVKGYHNAKDKIDIYHYRDKHDRKIDLIMMKGTKLYPLQIRLGTCTSGAEKDVCVLEDYKKEMNMDVEPTVVVCITDFYMERRKNTWLCPLSKI